MAQDNESLVRSGFDAWNERDFDRGADLFADDATILIVGSGDTLRGPDGSRQFSRMWADAFPDGRVTVDRVVSSGDHVVVEYTGRGTQTGTLTTATGSIPPTGKSVTLQLCDVVEVRDGKIRSQHTYFDSGSLLTQLGVMAAQAETAR